MSAQVTFKATNKVLARTDEFYVVEKSRNYLYAGFTFSGSSWSGTKTAVFTRDSQDYEVELDANGECKVPEECIASIGWFEVKVKSGTYETGTVRVFVYESGYRSEGVTSRKYITDEIERLRARLAAMYGNLNDRITELEKRKL